MAGRIQRAALALLGGLVALGPLVASAGAVPAEARAGRSGACTDGTGITVVVDASAFGDGVQVRCAPQPVRSGFDALTRAGFTFSGTTQFPGLLCRIDGEPTADPCHAAPPANAYWAYWHAPRGGSWTYSTSGAGSRVPPPGSVEGWAFGKKVEPGVDPPEPTATTTTRPPTTTTPLSGGGTGGEAGGTGSPATSDGTAATTGAGVEPTTSTTTEGSDDPTTGDAGAGGTRDDDRSQEAASVSGPSAGGGSGGSPAGAVVGLVVVAALAIAGIGVARRRRSEEGLA